MNVCVSPLNVSPLIKALRWILLLAGWNYGTAKRARYAAIEKVERPKREAALEEEHVQNLIEGKKRGIADLKNLFKEMDLEPDSGWESSV